MEDAEPRPYRVHERDGNFEVLDDSGNVTLVCYDEASAANYAVLLCDAYQRGYKAGYRDAKKLAARPLKN